MKSLKTLESIGAALTIVGSFLPWERAGGFLGSVTHGIRVDFVNFKYWFTGIHSFPVYDYGGVLVILLTLVIVLLTFQPPRFIKNPMLWDLMVSVVLMAVSMFYMLRWLMHWSEYRNTIEQPTLMVGLLCVVLGSALLSWKAMMTYPSVRHRQPKKAG